MIFKFRLHLTSCIHLIYVSQFIFRIMIILMIIFITVSTLILIRWLIWNGSSWTRVFLVVLAFVYSSGGWPRRMIHVRYCGGWQRAHARLRRRQALPKRAKKKIMVRSDKPKTITHRTKNLLFGGGNRFIQLQQHRSHYHSYSFRWGHNTQTVSVAVILVPCLQFFCHYDFCYHYVLCTFQFRSICGSIVAFARGQPPQLPQLRPSVHHL